MMHQWRIDTYRKERNRYFSKTFKPFVEGIIRPRVFTNLKEAFLNPTRTYDNADQFLFRLYAQQVNLMISGNLLNKEIRKFLGDWLCDLSDATVDIIVQFIEIDNEAIEKEMRYYFFEKSIEKIYYKGCMGFCKQAIETSMKIKIEEMLKAIAEEVSGGLKRVTGRIGDMETAACVESYTEKMEKYQVELVKKEVKIAYPGWSVSVKRDGRNGRTIIWNGDVRTSVGADIVCQITLKKAGKRGLKRKRTETK